MELSSIGPALIGQARLRFQQEEGAQVEAAGLSRPTSPPPV